MSSIAWSPYYGLHLTCSHKKGKKVTTTRITFPKPIIGRSFSFAFSAGDENFIYLNYNLIEMHHVNKVLTHVVGTFL